MPALRGVAVGPGGVRSWSARPRSRPVTWRLTRSRRRGSERRGRPRHVLARHGDRRRRRWSPLRRRSTARGHACHRPTPDRPRRDRLRHRSATGHPAPSPSPAPTPSSAPSLRRPRHPRRARRPWPPSAEPVTRTELTACADATRIACTQPAAEPNACGHRESGARGHACADLGARAERIACGHRRRPSPRADPIAGPRHAQPRHAHRPRRRLAPRASGRPAATAPAAAPSRRPRAAPSARLRSPRPVAGPTPIARPSPSPPPAPASTRHPRRHRRRTDPSPAPSLPPIPDPVTAGPVPKGLTPRLKDVKDDLPESYADGCHLGFDEEQSGDCVYGATRRDDDGGPVR